MTTGPDRRRPAADEVVTPAARPRAVDGHGPTLPGSDPIAARGDEGDATFDPYMATRRARDLGHSMAGWSRGGGPLTTSAGDGIATPADARYQDLELAGAGGMGTVMMAHDRRLGRDIAIKRVGVDGDDPVAQRRLAREAQITARLEHPGIVPVYDAGVGPDGRSYYAMRLIRGRSLAEVLDGLADANARLPLLRSFLAVCQAMAYAHRHGVVHLDLKPSNVMIGEFGETLVVDWGLAHHADEDAATGEPSAAWPAGTPAYLSPERARGARGDATADVWSLGAILVELITGRRLMPGSTIETLAQLTAEEAPPRAWPERAPPELCAIADKAVAWAERDRYPDAEALSRDVAAYLDGRRVAAHDYSTVELARRLVLAWRWQLIAVAAAVIAAIVVLGLSRQRIEGQRERAVTAERKARTALAETRSALTRALEQSAVAALTAGDLPAAETDAALALTHGESVDARGVLAATRGGSRPAAATRLDLPGCAEVIPDDDAHALCRERDQLALWHLPDRALRWRRPQVASHAVSLGGRWVVSIEDGVAITVRDAAGEVALERKVPLEYDEVVRDHRGRRAAVFDSHTIMLVLPDQPGDARVRGLGRPCGTAVMPAVALAARRTFALCADGRLLAIDDDGAVTAAATIPLGVRPFSALAVDERETTLAVGDLDGGLRMVALATGASTRARVLEDRVAQIAFVGELIAVVGERGGARVWNRTLDAELLRLPEASGRVLVGTADALLSGGASWWKWSLTPAPAPRRFLAPAGLSSAAVSPDGRLVVAARGDGRLSVWSAATGVLLAEPTVASQVIKRIDFSADGARLAAAISGPVGSAVLATATWSPLAHDPVSIGAARIAYLADDELVAVHRDHILTRWRAGHRDELPVVGFIDADRSADRRALWLLTRAGLVTRYADGALTELFLSPGAESLAATDDQRWLAVAQPERVELHDRVGGAVIPLSGSGDPITDLAFSTDGTWLAAATVAGTIDVWSVAGQRWVAHLRGHQQRVAWVGFSEGALWSASWDGVVLRWDLTALAADPAALAADAVATWALPTR